SHSLEKVNLNFIRLMEHLTARILTFSFAGLAVVSSLSLNSCKKQITEVDTVYVHSGDSSAWVNRRSGTTNDLVTGAFQGTTGYVSGGHGTVLQTTDAGNTWQVVSAVPIFEPSNGPGTV